MNVFKKIWNFISTLGVIAVVLLAIALVGVRVVGLTPYAVLSGSMEPTYHVGSLIYVKDIAPADIEVGMPLTFVVNEDLLVATHRVVDIEVFTTGRREVLDENGNTVYEEYELEEASYYFQTKGDANNDVDGAPVYYKNVVGTPVFSIPYLGYLSSWLQTKKGMIMGGSIALVVVLLTFLPDILNAVDDDPKKNAAKKGKSGKDENAEAEVGEDAHKDD